MSTSLLFVSLIAGMLSVLAPCVVGMLPVLMARGANGKRVRSPLWVICGLAGSIFAFSILLKSTTLLIDVPDAVWKSVSGSIVIGFGVFMLWPSLWEAFTLKLGLATKSQQLMAKSSSKKGGLGDLLLGASLGPVFSACSPTYLLIVATILPAEPLHGIIYLITYLVGLAAVTWAIVLAGRRLLAKLKWGINPHSLFHRIMGVILIFIGIMLLTGLDKLLLAWLVEHGVFDWQVQLETFLQ